ncbi:MAG: hypothetical protein KC713_05925, partial [Candidatus Omnitrophica bacterium]|nr:hypothetical protein [Candidatus Omnitrophota bacterium]
AHEMSDYPKLFIGFSENVKTQLEIEIQQSINVHAPTMLDAIIQIMLDNAEDGFEDVPGNFLRDFIEGYALGAFMIYSIQPSGGDKQDMELMDIISEASVDHYIVIDEIDIQNDGIMADQQMRFQKSNPNLPQEKSSFTSDELLKGGIDFNPSALRLNIQRDETGKPLTLEMQLPQLRGLEGLVPVIINITPVTNPVLILGFHPEDIPREPPQHHNKPQLTAL